MPDNVLDFYQIRKSSTPTICVECVHFMNVAVDDKTRSDIWYNHLCLASPLPKRINYVTGIEQHYLENDTGKVVFTDQEYKYCKDVNDGKCPRFIKFTPTE